MSTVQRTSRRSFLGQSALAAAGLGLAGQAQGAFFKKARPRVISPNERLNIAGIGVGGKGAGDLASTSVGQNVVAICDVDENTLTAAAKKYPGAKLYTDWRKMLEQGNIDAVTVSTPAIQLGKHVYVQKPLTHTIYEARQLAAAAREYGVVTQMGNQGHSGTGYKTLVKWVQDGLIGQVKEAHTWSNRPIWPQGISRPTGNDPVPGWLHWDEWLGVAPHRPYVGPKDDTKRNRGPYHPFNWRGFVDFGTGALGDMGCHIMDPVVWSLGLGAPLMVWSDGPACNGETFPEWEIIHYEFPATRHTTGPTVRMTWYDGGRKPERDLFPLPGDAKITDNGCLLIGTNGTILCPHGGKPELLPQDKFKGKKVAEVAGDDHYLQWTNACKGTDRTTSHFDYAGSLTETVLLGTIAVHFPGERLVWDSEKLRFTNSRAATELTRIKYRRGWRVKGLG
jgi:predicted dehydrogenase